MHYMQNFRKIINTVHSNCKTVLFNPYMLSIFKYAKEELDYMDEFENKLLDYFNNSTFSEENINDYKKFIEYYVLYKDKILPDYATNIDIEALLINLDIEEYNDVNPNRRALDFYNFYVILD